MEGKSRSTRSFSEENIGHQWVCSVGGCGKVSTMSTIVWVFDDKYLGRLFLCDAHYLEYIQHEFGPAEQKSE